MLVVLDWCDNVQIDVDTIPGLFVFANNNTFEITYGYDEIMPAILLAAVFLQFVSIPLNRLPAFNRLVYFHGGSEHHQSGLEYESGPLVGSATGRFAPGGAPLAREHRSSHERPFPKLVCLLS